MTTTTLPQLPHRAPTAQPVTPPPAPSRLPEVWAAPTPEVLRSLEAALTRWSS